MRYYSYRVFIFCFIFTIKLLANDNENDNISNIKYIAKNTIYLEIGGQGIGLSLNYDYRFKPNWTFRVGASFLAVGAGWPISINYLMGEKNSHHLELGAGLTYAEIASFLGGNKNTFIPSLLLGYKYQPYYGGFILKISFTPLFLIKKMGLFEDTYNRTIKKNYEVHIHPFAGISIGYCFK